MKATGIFEVKLTPIDSYVKGKHGVNLGRMSIDKSFNGESQGEMLSAMTTTQGSAGYVATEQVEGALAGKSGSFVLQNFGTMDKGSDRLILEVIADSGVGELAGLPGSMKINVDNGEHFNDF